MMGAAATYQAAFCGKVDQEEFTQQVDFEVVNNVRYLVTRRAKTQIFTFSGLNYANAHTTTAQTVTDYEGTSYAVPFVASFTDGSTGTKVFEIEAVIITRRRVSPGLWDVVVKRTGSDYWVNGVKIINGPAWAWG